MNKEGKSSCIKTFILFVSGLSQYEGSRLTIGRSIFRQEDEIKRILLNFKLNCLDFFPKQKKSRSLKQSLSLERSFCTMKSVRFSDNLGSLYPKGMQRLTYILKKFSCLHLIYSF